jgi:hypothetical protein
MWRKQDPFATGNILNQFHGKLIYNDVYTKLNIYNSTVKTDYESGVGGLVHRALGLEVCGQGMVRKEALI